MLKMHPRKRPAGPPGRSATRLLAAVAPTVVHHHRLVKAPAQMKGCLLQRRVRVPKAFCSEGGGGALLTEGCRHLKLSHLLQCHVHHYSSSAPQNVCSVSCRCIEARMTLEL